MKQRCGENISRNNNYDGMNVLTMLAASYQKGERPLFFLYCTFSLQQENLCICTWKVESDELGDLLVQLEALCQGLWGDSLVVPLVAWSEDWLAHEGHEGSPRESIFFFCNLDSIGRILLSLHRPLFSPLYPHRMKQNKRPIRTNGTTPQHMVFHK